MTNTNNINLKKPGKDDFFNVDTWNENMDKIDTAVGDQQQLQTEAKSSIVSAINENYNKNLEAQKQADYASKVYDATVVNNVIQVNTGGAYKLEAGKVVKFKLQADLIQSTINISIDSGDNKVLNNADASKVTKLKQGVHEVYYDDSVFILVLKGVDTSDATVVASNILIGKTAYKDGQKITGTMPNKEAQILIPGKEEKSIATGYYSQAKIKGESNLIPGNIRKGVSVFGQVGTLVESQVYTFKDLKHHVYCYNSQSASGDYIFNIPSGRVIKSILLKTNLKVYYNRVNNTDQANIDGYYHCGQINGVQFTAASQSCNYMNNGVAHVYVNSYGVVGNNKLHMNIFAESKDWYDMHAELTMSGIIIYG